MDPTARRDAYNYLKLERGLRMAALNKKRTERNNHAERVGKLNAEIAAIEKDIKSIDGAMKFFT